ncbi:hypothetical protein CYMTET_36807 [Cymbomonas tetramitiformis]|uniref:Uncharacterized protein n=1 Tax=Cymbomonas tetramitiformis TaxID=36881 RepID=A0AAE0CGR9_9CHLO|nr:hypothetical protein CYMTET_36807 [Cymbomonas tetramitiformis]
MEAYISCCRKLQGLEDVPNDLIFVKRVSIKANKRQDYVKSKDKKVRDGTGTQQSGSLSDLLTDSETSSIVQQQPDAPTLPTAEMPVQQQPAAPIPSTVVMPTQQQPAAPIPPTVVMPTLQQPAAPIPDRRHAHSAAACGSDP